ncbi:MAG TPA: YbaB/EbfC family nucleoid-associated protein [bacterium]|jgi:DNA-binding YbaB/EbfC family protein|nr:YbaB/EbfC family nucleoid-associated protein [bacterium]
MFDKAKDLYRLQKEARAVQKELKSAEIEASSNNGAVTVIFSGDQHIKNIEIDSGWLTPDKKGELEKEIVKVVGEAISRAQAYAAEKTKKLMGDMGVNFPGM